MADLRRDAERVIKEALCAVLPDEAVMRALKEKEFGSGKVYVVAVGKAAWQMARAAGDLLGERLEEGIVITKYGHVLGELPGMCCYEAGHPVPDQNSFAATQKVLDLAGNLKKEDTVVFLLSGGGSSLFEKPLVPGEELECVTQQLLACGADIVEINTIRKRLSAVKGGRFAQLCEPASVFCVVLSDILGDPLDMIASGPACPDSSTSRQAKEIAAKYRIEMSERAKGLLEEETPKELRNVETRITGSVRQLCRAAAAACEGLGYQAVILTDQLDCEAGEAGAFLASVARTYQDSRDSLAFLAGGETIVHLNGMAGKGGRNQEIVLRAAAGISGLENTAVFSIGSDGTDGPTDAAGGYCDGETKEKLKKLGYDIGKILEYHNSYTALEACGGLIKTGPTGTNVNDVAVVLIKR